LIKSTVFLLNASCRWGDRYKIFGKNRLRGQGSRRRVLTKTIFHRCTERVSTQRSFLSCV